jgi:hypothetical protein
MTLTYGCEQFFLAVQQAIASDESPQARLANAYILNIKRISREDVPDDKTWRRIQKLNQVLTEDGNTVYVRTAQMSTEEAAVWLQEIALIFSDISRALGETEKSKAAN